jgi:hypothetical protein
LLHQLQATKIIIFSFIVFCHERLPKLLCIWMAMLSSTCCNASEPCRQTPSSWSSEVCLRSLWCHCRISVFVTALPLLKMWTLVCLLYLFCVDLWVYIMHATLDPSSFA